MAGASPVGISVNAESSLTGYGTLSNQPLHQKSACLLGASRTVLKQYHSLTHAEPVISNTEEVRKELNKEVQFAREIIFAGKTSVQWDIKALLYGTKGELKRAPPLKNVALSDLVETMLEQGRDEERHGRPWVQMATDVKKAYKKVYRIVKRLE